MEPNEIESPLMTRDEVAAYLRIGVRSLDKIVRAGHLPILALYSRPRFRRVDVEKLANEGVPAQKAVAS